MSELKALNEIVDYIKEKEEYKRCILLKNKMKENKELMDLIDNVKKKQKEYIRSSYNEEVKKKLDILNDKLDKFPIYLEYNNNLKVINEELELLKERLNEYFDNVINIDL